jgi:hypothetical protein
MSNMKSAASRRGIYARRLLILLMLHDGDLHVGATELVCCGVVIQVVNSCKEG